MESRNAHEKMLNISNLQEQNRLGRHITTCPHSGQERPAPRAARARDPDPHSLCW